MIVSFSEHKKKLFKDKEFRKAFEEMEPEFALISRIIEKRIKGELTQAELAKKMGTKQSAISRFESGRYSPSLPFLYRLADALDVKLKITVT